MGLTGFINKYKNKIFNIAVLLLVLIFAYRVIYKKQVQEIQSLNETKVTEAKKNEVLEDISRLEKRIDAYKNLLPRKDASLILNTISNIAKESGITIASIKPMVEENYPDYIKSPFSLTLVTSSYHALGKFLSQVESLQDVYIVDAVQIQPSGKTGELSVNLKLSSITFIR